MATTGRIRCRAVAITWRIIGRGPCRVATRVQARFGSISVFYHSSLSCLPILRRKLQPLDLSYYTRTQAKTMLDRTRYHACGLRLGV